MESKRKSRLVLLVVLTCAIFSSCEIGVLSSSKDCLMNSPVQRLRRSQSTRQAVIYAGNNYKPNFVNCSSYEPQILEEDPYGTVVIKVVAVDNDPLDRGGLLTYSLVEPPDADAYAQNFIINSATGIITTNRAFNRDDPDREKEVWATVRAADNGIPQLDAVCSFPVKIVDINDNAPIFDRATYEERVPLDIVPPHKVMRVSATDIDEGRNKQVHYWLEAEPGKFGDLNYLAIDNVTGEISLIKPVSGLPVHTELTLKAVAQDNGEPQLESRVQIKLMIDDATKQPPQFINSQMDPIVIREDFTNFSAVLLRLHALSQVPDDKKVFFDLVTGTTEQTNKLKHFVVEQDGETALLKLGRLLNYETTSQYYLTIRATNKYDLAAETLVVVKLEDVNNQLPEFQDAEQQGTVLEEEPAGTLVMQIRAIDADGTYPNNKVTYHLESGESNFRIDSESGQIYTLRKFDREGGDDNFRVTVIAEDGAPSSFSTDGKHNQRKKDFKIVVVDKNDHEPIFRKGFYTAEIAEDADVGSKVLEVTAEDPDDASVLTYFIVDGNVEESFEIQSVGSDGLIIVGAHGLDYEKVKEYNITVNVTDSLSYAQTHIQIKVTNINDNKPVLQARTRNVTILEELIPHGCIFQIDAYDPDIEDRSAPQNLTFFIVNKEEQFTIDDKGCMQIVKPLDRELYPGLQIVIGVRDSYLAPPFLISTIEVGVILQDINDNTPRLNMPGGVTWQENQPPGYITQLIATDPDDENAGNGKPFNFRMDKTAPEYVQNAFTINTTGGLFARVKFDREEQKKWLIPVSISDSGTPRLTGTSVLTVIIGDVNDNPMSNGNSSILVYAYEDLIRNFTDIGRVYVDDLDDWDLPDKTFLWLSDTHQYFRLNKDTGMITIVMYTPVGMYTLYFRVVDNVRHEEANAIVVVEVRSIPGKAVEMSGSIRFKGITQEGFINTQQHGDSLRDQLQQIVANVVNASLVNVEVFTVLSPVAEDEEIIDTRFSAHGSPYYAPEKINGLLQMEMKKLSPLGLEILQVGITACVSEGNLCPDSCRTQLKVHEESWTVLSNRSSLAGVWAEVKPWCLCSDPPPPYLPSAQPTQSDLQSPCIPNPCLHKGTCVAKDNSYVCECVDGHDGPECQQLSIGFGGSGWAWYSALPACLNITISLSFSTGKQHGTLLYAGPMQPEMAYGDEQDYMLLEVSGAKVNLLLNLGAGVEHAVQLTSTALEGATVSDAKLHSVLINITPEEIRLIVDDCAEGPCRSFVTPFNSSGSRVLNTGEPLQVGGSSKNVKDIFSTLNWYPLPTGEALAGCVNNLTVSGTGTKHVYDLGSPSLSKGVAAGCHGPEAYAVLGVAENFLIALLVCLGLLLILVLLLVVYRRRRLEEGKDAGDEVRENIMDYADEGYGERDTSFDLSVLQQMAPPLPAKEAPYFIEAMPMQRREPVVSESPDVAAFLRSTKERADEENADDGAWDDVRHYAYEGDGNSTGSLSSLASATDDQDMDFNYLSLFGPRFKKLADMYGEQSDEESDESAPESDCDDRRRLLSPEKAPKDESWC